MLNIPHFLEITHKVRSCPYAIMSPIHLPHRNLQYQVFVTLFAAHTPSCVKAEHVWTMNWAHKQSLMSSEAIACFLVTSIPASFPWPFWKFLPPPLHMNLQCTNNNPELEVNKQHVAQ